MERKNIGLCLAIVSITSLISLEIDASAYANVQSGANRKRGYLRTSQNFQSPREQELLPIKQPQEKQINLSEPALQAIKKEQIITSPGETSIDEQMMLQKKQILEQAQRASLLTKIYATAAPIILISLSKALDSGIGAATKSMIKQLSLRKEFLNQQPELDKEKAQIKSVIDSLNIAEIEPNEKDAILAKLLQKQEKIDKLEQSASLTHIISTTAYTGMLSTLVPMMGALMGFGAKFILKSLMPADTPQ